MSPRIRALLATAILLSPALVPAPRAFACSCTNQHTALEEFGFAAAVFGGTVTGIQDAGNGNDEIVTMTPTVRWKGGLDSEVHLATPLNQGICGFPFAIGESYLVYAYNFTINGQPMLWTHLCSRNGPLDGNPDVNDLPAPELPVPARVHTWGALKTIYR